jgi:hypothetical protein
MIICLFLLPCLSGSTTIEAAGEEVPHRSYMKLEYSLEYKAKWYQDPYSERDSSTTSFSHVSVFTSA